MIAREINSLLQIKPDMSEDADAEIPGKLSSLQMYWCHKVAIGIKTMDSP